MGIYHQVKKKSTSVLCNSRMKTNIVLVSTAPLAGRGCCVQWRPSGRGCRSLLEVWTSSRMFLLTSSRVERCLAAPLWMSGSPYISVYLMSCVCRIYFLSSLANMTLQLIKWINVAQKVWKLRRIKLKLLLRKSFYFEIRHTIQARR